MEIVLIVIGLAVAYVVWDRVIDPAWVDLRARTHVFFEGLFTVRPPDPPEPPPLDFKPHRGGHMHILGGTGSGKTRLIQSFICDDLAIEDPAPAIVVIDSQRDMIRKLSRLLRFHPEYREAGYSRVTLIDPRDTPALNLFDVNRKRLAKYDEHTKAQIAAGIIESFDYLFAGILGSELTTKQGSLFRNIVRLMLTLPDTMGRTATMVDILKFMEDPTPYLPGIEALPDIPRAFFANYLDPKKNKGYAQTREQ